MQVHVASWSPESSTYSGSCCLEAKEIARKGLAPGWVNCELAECGLGQEGRAHSSDGKPTRFFRLARRGIFSL